MYGGGPHINGLDSTPAKVEVEVDFLIIGVGPAGASLACFLVQHGMTEPSGVYQVVRLTCFRLERARDMCCAVDG